LRALLSDFCLRRGGFFEGAKLFGRSAVNSRPRLACESQRYWGKRRCAQTLCVPVVETSKGPSQRIQTANDRRETSRSGRPQRVGRKAVEISGNPREACLRFLHRSGLEQKRPYREWTKPEQQRLLDLITTIPVDEAAKILRRPAGSVRSMLHRLAIGGRTGREWFTKYSLSRALHTRPEEIQKWIDCGG
jgi:hypothetical protein